MTSNVKTPLREIRFRVASLFCLIMLSSDSLNPVKIVCDILNIKSEWILFSTILLFLGIIIANAKELVYFMVKVFFHSILSIFFSSMEVIGVQNIPEHGPVIFTGNHMNQFVDGAVIVTTNTRRVSFLVAEKSFKKRIIGDFAKAVDAIPVARPQDKATPGPGRFYFDKLRIVGEGTKFTELKKGDKLRPGKSSELYKIVQVISDTEGILGNDLGEASPLDEKICQGEGKWTNYDILEWVDQSKMFDYVHTALANGKCIGIFPEGGSHDRSDLLPLKAGVAAIALGVKEKHDKNVRIVPVGLTYFRGHRFRGRVVVEFGTPIHISKELYQVYKTSKRAGYQTLLQQVEDGMRSVIVTAPDYSELRMIHTIRRLYQRAATGMTTKTKQDLARRFSAAYKILREKHPNGLPDDILELKKKLEAYQERLDYWGLRDYQLLGENLDVSFSKLLYTFVHMFFILILASIPSLILNAPVGFAANYWANKEAKKDLKASRVKLKARDVLLSKKIIFSLVAVPVLWLFYAVLLLLFTNMEIRTIVFLLLCGPLFSYLGVTAVEAGMVDFKDLKPVLLRLKPAFREEATELPKLRAALQKEVRALVKKYGPSFGSLYYDVHWENPHSPGINALNPHEQDKIEELNEKSIKAFESTNPAGNSSLRSARSVSEDLGNLDRLASSIASTLSDTEDDQNTQVKKDN